MRPLKCLIHILICVLAAGSVIGSRAQSHVMKSLTGADGLSDILINTIYKDGAGYVWFGTEGAVDRYDGNTLAAYPMSGMGRVNAILRAESGDVYVGSNGGLSIIRGGIEPAEPLLKDNVHGPVTALATDGLNNIYIAAEEGVLGYNYNRNELRRIRTGYDMLNPDNRFTDLLLADVKMLWALTADKLYKFDLNANKTETYDIPVDDGEACMFVSLDDIIYIAVRNEGVVPFDTRTLKFGDMTGFGNNLISGMTATPGRKLLVATDGDGVFSYNPQTRQIEGHLSTSDGNPRLKSNSVYSIMSDSMGLLWIGYYQMGVDYTPNFRDYMSAYSLPGADFDSGHYAVRSLAFDGSKKIIGTREGLFVTDDATGTVHRYGKPQMRANMIFSISPLGEHRFLIGTYNGGAYQLDTQTGVLTDFDSQWAVKSNGTVFAADRDKRGDLWLATSDGLVRIRRSGQTDVWNTGNSQLPEGNVYNIFFDSLGRGWICTENGMALWDGRHITTTRFPKDFIHNQKIRVIFEDSAHNLYFAPDRGKLYRANLNLSKFGPLEFGADEKVTTMFIAEDKDRWLWLGTDKGLIRYDKNRNFHHFNNADGLPNQVFTLCPPVLDKRGDLWMGNSAGLIRLDFDKFKKEDAGNHRPLTITNLMSNGKGIMPRLEKGHNIQKIDLASDETDVVVHVSDFGYRSSEFFVTEYMLDGIDDKWRRSENNAQIHVYDLPADDSRLKIRVQDDPRTETVLTIHRASGTNWALIAVIALLSAGLGASVYLIYRHRHAPAQTAMASSQPNIEGGDNGDGMSAPRHVSYRTTRLSDEECKRLLKALNSVMKNDKPYTRPNLKSQDLASMIGTKAHSLSFLFNQYLKKSFYDYVNEYRVAEFKRLVNETDISRYTLTALSERCGFSSRASFFRHFKAITGITPAEYIRQK